MRSGRSRMALGAVLLTLGAIAAACGSTPSPSSNTTPQAADIAAVPSSTTTSSTTTTTSGTVATGTQTLSVHVYLCQEYSNNGINDLETSMTEISNSTVSITGVTTSAEANPYSTTVNAGTYTVSATAPPGFYFTSCPLAAVTPTITNGAQSASGSVTVSTVAVSAAFYVVAFQTATCSAVSGGVTCLLPSTLGLPFYPLTSLLTQANGVSNSVSSSTPIVITAWGGNGGSGDADPATAYHGGPGGQAGKSQTALTSVANYEATNKTTVLFYYLGHQGVNGGQDDDTVAGFGGSATMVSPLNFATGTVSPCMVGYSTCATTNVLLIAGGGGGGGQGGLGFSGAHGGTAGTAIATTSGNLFVASGNGNQAGGNGGGAGFGGSDHGNCSGGAGGGAGHYADSQGGDAGNSGIGGTGGPMKKNTSGDSTGAIPWANAGYLNLVGTDGSGGRGVWGGDGFEDGGGGTGGGGCGGGGSAGSGGSTGAGGGAGAGGMFAAQAQVSTGSFTSPSHTSNNGQVYVTFVLS